MANGGNTTTGDTNVVVTGTGTATNTFGAAEAQLIGLIRDGQARGVKAQIIHDPITGYRNTTVEIDPWKEVKADIDTLAKSGDVELISASGAKMKVTQRDLNPTEQAAADQRVVDDLLRRFNPTAPAGG